MILLVDQVGRRMLDREAFQEIDYRRMFGEMAKWAAQINDPSRIPEYLSRAWHVALSGRPGPVVLALPEDMLAEVAQTPNARPPIIAEGAPTAEAMQTLSFMLEAAERPLLVVGGPSWNADCAHRALAFAERTGLPVATAFRYQYYADNDHENYVGVLGIAPLTALRTRVMDEVNLLIVVGPRLGEMTTQGYLLIESPNPRMQFVHVHLDPDELG